MAFLDFLLKEPATVPVEDRQDAPKTDVENMSDQIGAIGDLANAANNALIKGGDIFGSLGEAFKGFADIGLGLGGSASSTSGAGDINVQGTGMQIPSWVYLVGFAVLGYWVWKK